MKKDSPSRLHISHFIVLIFVVHPFFFADLSCKYHLLIGLQPKMIRVLYQSISIYKIFPSKGQPQIRHSSIIKYKVFNENYYATIKSKLTI